MELEREEREFLRKLIMVHREYYGILVGHGGCSAANRDRYRFIEGLSGKLTDESDEHEKVHA